MTRYLRTAKNLLRTGSNNDEALLDLGGYMKRFASLAMVFIAEIGVAQGQKIDPLVLAQTIPLEGVEGRIDHMSIDTNANRMYVAALGNNSIEVLDLTAGKRVGTTKDPKEPQGITIIPETRTIVVASGSDGMCRTYAPSLKQIGAINDLEDADNVRYDRHNKSIYVGYGKGVLAAIDPTGPAKLRETKLKGHPESFQLEQDGNRIFVNVPTARQIAVVDKQTGKVLAEWPIKDAEANFPMALDEKEHRLFVGCRRPAKMLVVDAESGSSMAALDCCGDTDDIFWDALRKRIYVSGGEGCVSVFEQTGTDHYRPLATISTAVGARTSYFDSSTSRLYVAVPRRGSKDAEIRVYHAQS